jgi:hypothetical protein
MFIRDLADENFSAIQRNKKNKKGIEGIEGIDVSKGWVICSPALHTCVLG